MSPTARSAAQIMAELELQERRNALPGWIAKSYISSESSLKRGSEMMNDYANELTTEGRKTAKTMLSADSLPQDALDMSVYWDQLRKQQYAESQLNPDEDEDMTNEGEKDQMSPSVRAHSHSGMPEWISRPVIGSSSSPDAGEDLMDQYWAQLKKQQRQEAKTYSEIDEDDDDETTVEEEVNEDEDRDYMTSFRARLKRNARAFARLSTHVPHDIELDWDEMSQALQATGNPLAAARLTRLNKKARFQDADHSEENNPRNRLCEDFVAALSDLEGPTGLHGRQFAGLRRVRKIKIIIKDFGGVGEDEEAKDLEEADEEWMYVATMEE